MLPPVKNAARAGRLGLQSVFVTFFRRIFTITSNTTQLLGAIPPISSITSKADLKGSDYSNACSFSSADHASAEASITSLQLILFDCAWNVRKSHSEATGECLEV
jgi:hypothetical protein